MMLKQKVEKQFNFEIPIIAGADLVVRKMNSGIRNAITASPVEADRGGRALVTR
jgi:hypothetical protein